MYLISSSSCICLIIAWSRQAFAESNGGEREEWGTPIRTRRKTSSSSVHIGLQVLPLKTRRCPCFCTSAPSLQRRFSVPSLHHHAEWANEVRREMRVFRHSLDAMNRVEVDHRWARYRNNMRAWWYMCNCQRSKYGKRERTWRNSQWMRRYSSHPGRWWHATKLDNCLHKFRLALIFRNNGEISFRKKVILFHRRMSQKRETDSEI